MTEKRMFREIELAALAKKFRQKSGKKKAVLGRELGVTRATMQDAEERPEVSLTKLRCRIIEACSLFEVHGPGFWLKRKPGKQTAQATPSSSSVPPSEQS
jgi:DNA-binding XRE family transcriptional regulator